METLQNLSVKIFFKNNSLPAPVNTFHKLFNQWIRDWPEEIWVDVADYSHLYHGPVMVLVAHDANYSLDAEEGRPGLIYSRKTQLSLGSSAEVMQHSILKALFAAQKLANEPDLKGGLAFKGEELELQLNNRYLSGEMPDPALELKSAVEPLLPILYGNNKVSFSQGQNPKKRVRLNISVSPAYSIHSMLSSFKVHTGVAAIKA